MFSVKVFRMHCLYLLVSVNFRVRNSTNQCAFKVSSVTTQLDKHWFKQSKMAGVIFFILMKIFSSAHTTSETLIKQRLYIALGQRNKAKFAELSKAFSK